MSRRGCYGRQSDFIGYLSRTDRTRRWSERRLRQSSSHSRKSLPASVLTT